MVRQNATIGLNFEEPFSISYFLHFGIDDLFNSLQPIGLASRLLKKLLYEKKSLCS